MLIDILASIMGVLMSLGHYPQAYKILKNKSAKDVSLISYSIFSLGTVTMLIYGIAIKSLPLILSFIVGIIGSWAVLILTLIYRKK